MLTRPAPLVRRSREVSALGLGRRIGRPRLLRITLPVLAVVFLSIAGTGLHVAAAASPQERVWVVDDVSVYASCRLNGALCPARAAQVFHIYQTTMAMAQAQQRPHISARADADTLAEFIQQVALQSQGRSKSTVGPLLNCQARPVTDSFQVTLPDIHSTVTAQQSYTVNSDCSRTVTGNSFATQLKTTPNTWKDHTAYIYDLSGHQLASDGQSGACAALPHSSNFGTITTYVVNPPHTYVEYSSGSNCTIFDTFDAVNYTWST